MSSNSTICAWSKLILLYIDSLCDYVKSRLYSSIGCYKGEMLQIAVQKAAVAVNIINTSI